MWFVVLQHGPGLQGPLMKLLGQLHLTTSNVSLQRQMQICAGNCQQMLMAARYPAGHNPTHSDRWIHRLPQVRFFAATKLCLQMDDIADVCCAGQLWKTLVVLGLHWHKLRRM